MALFDKQKFINFYGFAPNVLEVDKYVDVNGLLVQGASRASAIGGNKLNKTLSTRPENPISWENDFEKTLVSKLTINDQYEFDPPPVITVNLKKNVVTTKVAGSSQTPVVEIIGFDTFQIKIQGYVENKIHHKLDFNPNLLTKVDNTLNLVKMDEQNIGELSVREDRFPIKKLEEFRELFNKNEALAVDSILLKKMGITQIVITQIPEMTYYPSAFTYTINAIADQHKELLVLQK